MIKLKKILFVLISFAKLTQCSQPTLRPPIKIYSECGKEFEIGFYFVPSIREYDRNMPRVRNNNYYCDCKNCTISLFLLSASAVRLEERVIAPPPSPVSSVSLLPQYRPESFSDVG